MIEHREGKANFKANLSGKDKGPGKRKGVFYNPSMKFSRDLNVEFAKKLNFKGLFLDGMAASGIRGMRLALECNYNVEFCDTSKLAVEAIKDNLKLNNLKSEVFHDDLQNLVKERQYDWIDVDPFGTPAPYLESIIENVNDGGILGIAATDTAVLCGAKPSICFKRYGAYSMKRVAAKEVGIGGIFFDYKMDDWKKDFDFVKDVGLTFNDIVREIISQKMNEKFTKKDKEIQLLKRGRYVEYNLLYDRGTKFGLNTGGNIDAILMSMPPNAKWK